ncbi:MAG: N-acetylglucosamine-6-phosphate deacetylase [Acidobacteriaceae bacterium]|nr:N-acetylglucosamine-6-phosphate deacetylase [Acidobacteriaceae bacterium]
MIALSASRLYTPVECVEQPLVVLDGDRIVEIRSRESRSVPPGAQLIDLGELILAPAFLDLHIHGGAGQDVMSADPAGLEGLERFLAKHGVGAYFPTTVTAPIDKILSALAHLADAIEAAERSEGSDAARAQPIGIHLEGPFISHIRRGVHPAGDLLPPKMEFFERFWQAARGHIRVMTIAPELEGAQELIAEATRRGVCVSLGHSDADFATTRSGLAAGARHFTHAFNAMRPLNHREPGIIGEMLTDRKASADIIADGIHLHPAVVDLFLKAKGPDLAVLITDALAATGMPEGHYKLGNLDVEVKEGRCTANGTLAGSVLTMDRAVRNIMQFAGWDLQHALRPASLNPAKAAGFTNRGKLEAGCRADIVVLSPQGEVRNVILGGITSQKVTA